MNLEQVLARFDPKKFLGHHRFEPYHVVVPYYIHICCYMYVSTCCEINYCSIIFVIDRWGWGGGGGGGGWFVEKITYVKIHMSKFNSSIRDVFYYVRGKKGVLIRKDLFVMENERQAC